MTSTTQSLSPKCEGAAHASGEWGHDDGPAKFSVSCKHCGQSTVLLCSGRVNSILANPEGAYCDACRIASVDPRRVFTFTKLVTEPRHLEALPRPGDPLNAFILDQRARGHSETTTIPNRIATLRAVERHSGRSLLELNEETLVAYLARPGVTAATRRSNKVVLAAFYRFALKKGLRPDNPAAELPDVRVPRTKPRPFTREQIDMLLSTGAYAQTRAMILLGYYQGFRVSSIARVHGRDIDLAAGTIRTIGKGSKDRTLPLHPVIAALAASMPHDGWWFPGRTSRGGPILPSSVTDLVRKAKERAGIVDPTLTAHSLRHSFATHLIDDGTDIRVIQELMMHDNLGSTQVYAGVSDRLAREGLGRLPAMEIPTRSGRGKPGGPKR